MATGTSGYIESVHTKRLAPSSNAGFLIGLAKIGNQYAEEIKDEKNRDAIFKHNNHLNNLGTKLSQKNLSLTGKSEIVNEMGDYLHNLQQEGADEVVINSLSATVDKYNTRVSNDYEVEERALALNKAASVGSNYIQLPSTTSDNVLAYIDNVSDKTKASKSAVAVQVVTQTAKDIVSGYQASSMYIESLEQLEAINTHYDNITNKLRGNKLLDSNSADLKDTMGKVRSTLDTLKEKGNDILVTNLTNKINEEKLKPLPNQVLINNYTKEISKVNKAESNKLLKEAQKEDFGELQGKINGAMADMMEKGDFSEEAISTLRSYGNEATMLDEEKGAKARVAIERFVNSSSTSALRSFNKQKKLEAEKAFNSLVGDKENPQASYSEDPSSPIIKELLEEFVGEEGTTAYKNRFDSYYKGYNEAQEFRVWFNSRSDNVPYKELPNLNNKFIKERGISLTKAKLEQSLYNADPVSFIETTQNEAPFVPLAGKDFFYTLTSGEEEESKEMFYKMSVIEEYNGGAKAVQNLLGDGYKEYAVVRTLVNHADMTPKEAMNASANTKKTTVMYTEKDFRDDVYKIAGKLGEAGKEYITVMNTIYDNNSNLANSVLNEVADTFKDSITTISTDGGDVTINESKASLPPSVNSDMLKKYLGKMSTYLNDGVAGRITVQNIKDVPSIIFKDELGYGLQDNEDMPLIIPVEVFEQAIEVMEIEDRSTLGREASELIIKDISTAFKRVTDKLPNVQMKGSPVEEMKELVRPWKESLKELHNMKKTLRGKLTEEIE